MLELASITPIAATPFQNKWPQKKGGKFRIRTSDRFYSPFSRCCPVSAQKPAVSFYKRIVALSLFTLRSREKSAVPAATVSRPQPAIAPLQWRRLGKRKAISTGNIGRGERI